MNRITLALSAAALTLTGCTAAEVTNPGGQVSTDDLAKGTSVQVSADARKVATTIDEAFAVEGIYPSSAPSVTLTGTNSLVNYLATPAGYRFCVVEPKTGAWAFYDSGKGGLAGSGESGQTCAAGTATGLGAGALPGQG